MPADQKLVRTKLIAMARDAARKGDLRSAFRRYQRLRGLEPENPSFHIKLGELALKLEKQGQARDAYLRGAALFARAAFEEKAIAIYRRVIEFVPLDLEVWGLLADAYQRADRTREAIVALRTAAAELHGGDHHKHALQLRRKIAKLDPTDVRSRQQLAHELGFARMSEEAVSEYVECILQCAVQGEWDRIPSTFEMLVALRPEESAEDEDQDDRRAAETDALLERILTSRRYEEALHDMYRRMSELGRQQARSLESL